MCVTHKQQQQHWSHYDSLQTHESIIGLITVDIIDGGEQMLHEAHDLSPGSFQTLS